MPRRLTLDSAPHRPELAGVTDQVLGMALRGVFRAVAAYDAIKDRTHMMRGVTEPVETSRELGYPAERSLAYKRMFRALDTQIRNNQQNSISADSPRDAYLPELPGPLRGKRDMLYMFDPAEENRGLVVVQKQNNQEYGDSITVTYLEDTVNDNGVRKGYDMTLSRANWESSLPNAQVRHFMRHGDTLDQSLLNGELFRAPLSGSDARIASLMDSTTKWEITHVDRMSADMAKEFSLQIARLLPINIGNYPERGE